MMFAHSHVSESKQHNKTGAQEHPVPFFQAKKQVMRTMSDGLPELGTMQSGEKTDTGTSKQAASASPCITLNSFTVTPSAPGIVTSRRGNCELKMGLCSTPRGQCGTTGTGMVMRAEVSAPANCVGQLAFAQNILSTDRRKTLSDGSQECLKASSPHADGAIPWKGCVVDVNTAGTHVIQSDDCPSILLESNVTAHTVLDRFKTFLLWKPNGASSRQPFASATWSWGGTVTRSQPNGDCQNQWVVSNPVQVPGTGAVSQDSPVQSPTIQGLSYGSCH